MYDIPELENKWKKWKRKQRQKPVIITAVALLIISSASVAIYYLKSKKDEIKSVAKAPTEVQSVKKDENVTKSNNSIIITKKSFNNPKQTQESNIEIKKNNDETIDITKAQIIKPNVPDEDVRVIGFDKKSKKDMKNKYSDLIKSNGKVVSQESAEDAAIQEIKDRFKATQDTKDSLYLAKFYYNKGDYAKAESWAISTNNIDGDIEESWLIFAKARAKQGKRVDAIKVLQTYYDETKSAKAKALLKKLRLGQPFK